MQTPETCAHATRSTAWPIGGLLLDALTRRDFDGIARLCADDVRFRALVPPGPFELTSAAAVAEKFRTWFGGDDEFEILDASLGTVGPRGHARWRVRMSPVGRPDEARIAEQQVYLSGTDRVEAMDLLCSGFHRDLS